MCTHLLSGWPSFSLTRKGILADCKEIIKKIAVFRVCLNMISISYPDDNVKYYKLYKFVLSETVSLILYG
jgi:hypothetical protein